MRPNAQIGDNPDSTSNIFLPVSDMAVLTRLFR